MPERKTPSEIHEDGDELAEMDTLPSEPDPVPAGDPPLLADLALLMDGLDLPLDG
jgi:hypothetical protein